MANYDTKHLTDAVKIKISELVSREFPRGDPIQMGKTDYVIVSKRFKNLCRIKLEKLLKKNDLCLHWDNVTGTYVKGLEQFIKKLKRIIDHMEKHYIPYLQKIITKEEWADCAVFLKRLHLLNKERVRNLVVYYGNTDVAEPPHPDDGDSGVVQINIDDEE